MTEQEAKDKWCPFSRVIMAKGSNANATILMMGGANRVQWDDSTTEPLNGSRCIGSECMAWRPLEIPGQGRCGLVPRT